MTDGRRVLVVVHPGSACGSADFNLGIDAGPLREALAREITDWRGGVLVVDGELSDELDLYANMNLALTAALDQGRTSGGARRIRACAMADGDWVGRTVDEFRTTWPDAGTQVVVTGAWTQEDGNGCVDAVHDALGATYPTTRSEQALPL